MSKKGEKKAFLMHFDFESSFVMLNDQEYREMMEGIFHFAKTREVPKFSSRLLDALFLPIKQTLLEDLESYDLTCAKRQENGSLGGRPKNQNKSKKPNGFVKTKSNQNEPKEPDIDYDSDYNSVCNKKDTLCDDFLENDEVQCHLGSEFKNESCFDCMKKKICPLKESPQFLARHSEGFESWNQQREESFEKLQSSEKIREKPPDDNDFDYNWLEGEQCG